MQLVQTHSEPTSDSRTGTATYFRAVSVGSSGSVKVLAYAPAFGKSTETQFSVHVFRQAGWTQVIELVEASSPADAAEQGMLVLGWT